MGGSSKQRRRLLSGLAFLGPNILGFLAFTILPVALSLVLAFSNWDLRLHNIFKDASLKVVWLDNFHRLLTNPEFWRFLGNTLFLMMGIPFAIAGSLGAAMLLSQDLRGSDRRVFGILIAATILVASVVMLAVVGAGGSGMIIVITGLACVILCAGAMGGTTVYRTLFYLPHFTAGVAVYILWKKLYAPHTGPINGILLPILDSLSQIVRNISPGAVQAGFWLCLALMLWLLAFGLRQLRRMWRDGDLGGAAAALPVAFLLMPIVLAQLWLPKATSATAPLLLLAAAFAVLGWQGFQARTKRFFTCATTQGFGSALMLSLALMVAQFALLGIGIVCYRLPAMAAQGLNPPEWLTNYYWAKPAIMIMGLWAAIGSNNMLLYLAGLTNVPSELYEAADIDGAAPLQKFWHVTWPQLAPVTFYVVVMSVIGGLQGGFEMARTMTQGGPAGATTTLSYFIYMEGFETGRLGYASAIAWSMFIMVFAITLFNWKFGSRYVND